VKEAFLLVAPPGSQEDDESAAGENNHRRGCYWNWGLARTLPASRLAV
jgi:hypothetical protein